jgi:hypothetical protein
VANVTQLYDARRCARSSANVVHAILATALIAIALAGLALAIHLHLAREDARGDAVTARMLELARRTCSSHHAMLLWMTTSGRLNSALCGNSATRVVSLRVELVTP